MYEVDLEDEELTLKAYKDYAREKNSILVIKSDFIKYLNDKYPNLNAEELIPRVLKDFDSNGKIVYALPNAVDELPNIIEERIEPYIVTWNSFADLIEPDYNILSRFSRVILVEYARLLDLNYRYLEPVLLHYLTNIKVRQ